MKWIRRHPRAFFIILSAFLWLASRLSSDEVVLNLQYKMAYKGFVVTPDQYLPTELSLRLQGNGYVLLREWLNPLRKLELQKSALDDLRPEWVGGFRVADLQLLIEEQLPMGLRLEKMLDAERRLNIPSFVVEYWPLKKRVPDKLAVEDYAVKLLGLPDSLRVSGLKEELDAWREKGLSIGYEGPFPGRGWHSVSLEVLAPANGRLIVEPRTLEAEVYVDLSTTVYRSVPITLPEEWQDQSLVVPSKVEVAFHVPMTEFEDFLQAPIQANIISGNFSSGPLVVDLQMEKRLQDQLLYSQPAAVELIQLSP